jgi:hypothetical protein
MAEIKVKLSAQTEQAAKDISKAVKEIVKDVDKIPAAVAPAVAAVEDISDAMKDVGQGAGAGLKTFTTDLQRSIGPIRAVKLSQDELRRSTLEGASAMKKLSDESNRLKPSVSGIAPPIAAANKALQQVPNNSNRASFAVLNLGRIAQDSAFGFIGIANNIEPFTQSLTALRRESGSAGGALKAFFGALGGPAVIGIIIGAISLIDAYSKGYGVFSGNASKAAQASKQFAERQKEVAEAAKATANDLAKEVVQIQSLASIANDENRSRGERLKAIEQLRKAYPDYLRGLSNEEALSKGVAAATDAVTKSLIRRIVIEAAREQLTKNISDAVEKALANERILAQEAPKVTKAFEGQNDAYNNYVKLSTGFNTAAERDAAALRFVGKATIATTEDLKGFGQAQVSANRVLNQIIPLFKDVGDVIAGLGGEVNDFANTFGTVDKVTKETSESTKELKNSFDSYLKGLGTFNAGINATIQAYIQLNAEASRFAQIGKISDQLGDQKKIKEVVDAVKQIQAAGGPSDITTQGRGGAAAANDALTDYEKRLEFINAGIDSIANAAAQTLGPAIVGIFDSFGQGANAVQSLGKAFGTLTKQIAAAVVQALILRAIQGALGGVSPTGGLGSILSFLGGGSFKLPPTATGGIATRPTARIFGEAGPEAVIPLSQFDNIVGSRGGGDVNVTGRFTGQDLYLTSQSGGLSYSRLFG